MCAACTGHWAVYKTFVSESLPSFQAFVMRYKHADIQINSNCAFCSRLLTACMHIQVLAFAQLLLLLLLSI
jgi:hypothetical protein